MSLGLSLDVVTGAHGSGVLVASSHAAEVAMSTHQFPTLRHILRGIPLPNITGTGTINGYNATISPFSIQGISVSGTDVVSPVVILNTTVYLAPPSSEVPATLSGITSQGQSTTFSTANGMSVVYDTTVFTSCPQLIAKAHCDEV